jgi:hypothetical protein
MLRCAQHLAVDREKPFAEFTLSAANGLRVTLGDWSNGQGLFFTSEPCLRNKTCSLISVFDRELDVKTF